jgi:hypothetical protein
MVTNNVRDDVHSYRGDVSGTKISTVIGDFLRVKRNGNELRLSLNNHPLGIQRREQAEHT